MRELYAVRPRRSGWHLIRSAMVAAVALGVAVAGFAGTGSINGEELEKRLAAGDAPVVLDVRTPAEYEAGHIPGAINIPHDQLASRLGDVPAGPGDEVVVHCQSGGRARGAEKVLEKAGFTNVRDLDGHIADWKSQERPLE